MNIESSDSWRISNYNWRTNYELQLVIDHYACVEYLDKYAAKGDKISSVVRNAFVAIRKQTDLNNDPEATLHKHFIK